MAGSQEGSRRGAATKMGISYQDYVRCLNLGLVWCYACSSWRVNSAFAKDGSRSVGLSKRCRKCTSEYSRARYKPKPRERGRRYVAARDGDKVQARGRVNHLVRVGVIPDPDDLPCEKCGHVAGDGKRHEYDHYLGYGANHHEDVTVLCTKCHTAKDSAKANQTHCIRGHAFTKENTGRKANGTRFCRECRRGYDRKRRPAGWWRDYRAKKRSEEGK